MRNTLRPLLSIVCLLLVVAASANIAWEAPPSNILEKKFTFPSPVQWKLQDVEISLISMAWGPADSPEMISKGVDDVQVQKPEFYPDRTYVLALGFRARLPNVVSTSMITSSGLARIKNVDGDIEPPMDLTTSGFVPFSGSPGVNDVRFNRSNTTEYWDLFPASPNQKQFLFEVLPFSGPGPSKGTPKLSFKISLKDDDFMITNVTPGAERCLNFSENFAGTVGANSRITLTLTREGARVSGTEQYVRVGKTLWLQGAADSLGNLVVEERYPKDFVTGIFKGALSQDCRMISGFFSKPDGSRLQPFEFREAEAAKP
jgi:hypothetical protein